MYHEVMVKYITLTGGLCNEPDIANGQVTGPSIITPNSILTIQCHTGFKMSHTTDVVCYSMDKFNPDPPTCDGKLCLFLGSCAGI